MTEVNAGRNSHKNTFTRRSRFGCLQLATLHAPGCYWRLLRDVRNGLPPSLDARSILFPLKTPIVCAPRHSDPATDAASKHEKPLPLPLWILRECESHICFMTLFSRGIPGVLLPKSPPPPSPLKEMFPFKAPEDACLEGEGRDGRTFPHLPGNIRGGTVSRNLQKTVIVYISLLHVSYAPCI